MFELALPWALLALPLPLLTWWLLPPHRERSSALRVPFFSEITRAAGVEGRPGAVVAHRRGLQILIAGLVWTLIVIGLAKPEWVGEPIVRQEAARDVMLAVDLSGSMDYADFPDEAGGLGRRIDGVERVVDAFVAAREHDRVGLIVFGTRAYLQLPFTRDLTTARELVGLMDVGMAGPQTALGDAIGLAMHAFEDSGVEDRLLIMLTDGNDTASKMTPVNAADIARREGVTIYTIGIGDPDAGGEDRVDFTTLAKIAERTGGEFFAADDERALRAIYAAIDASQTVEIKTQTWRPRESLVHWPVGAALTVLLLGLVLLPAMGRRETAKAS